MSLPEVLLWQELRRRPLGRKFRRQHPFGPFVADLFNTEASLAIEIDGASHDAGGRPDHDAVRDAYFAARGVRTLRIAAWDVLTDLQSVLTTILNEVGASPLHHASHGPPPPLGEDQE